jgi:hypothetical protein
VLEKEAFLNMPEYSAFLEGAALRRHYFTTN